MSRRTMDYKEIREGRRVGIPESIIGRMVQGFPITEPDKEIVRSKGKVYVSGHMRDGKFVRPQLRDLPKGSKVLSWKTPDERKIRGLPDDWAVPEDVETEQKVIDWDLETFEDVKEKAVAMGSREMIALYNRIELGNEIYGDGLDMYKLSIGENPYDTDEIPQSMQDWNHYALIVSTARGYDYAKRAYEREKLSLGDK